MEGEFVWREGEWCGLEDVYQMSHIQLLVIPYNGQANYTVAIGPRGVVTDLIKWGKLKRCICLWDSMNYHC